MSPVAAAAASFVLVLATGWALQRARSSRAHDRTRRRLRPAQPTVDRSGDPTEPVAPAALVDGLAAAGYGALDPARVWYLWTVGGSAVVAAVALVLGPAAAALGALALARRATGHALVSS